ncbi:MAG TPA: trypsin-like peptidase domain-containing protein [Sandaracinaceae bacterium LLY-WYZ-13_1]|nr:trypsin-like peptidase domain-containing protein [Sandaracinaceae bacterium LLY-WYZ-13_1]
MRPWVCIAVAIVASLGCESGAETVEVEDFDADHGLRALRHEGGLDFAWVNTRMQHVVFVSIPTLGGGANACTGVLVAPDLVFTAGHCLKESAYLSDMCGVDATVSRGHVLFDQQIIQDATVGAPPPTMQERAPRRVSITGLVAHPDRRLFDRRLTPSGEPRCATPMENRHYDGVLLRLAESLPERGVARVRSAGPKEGQLLPVIHHFGRDTTKHVSAAVALDSSTRPIGPDLPASEAIIATPVVLPPGLANVQEGSSGAPLFDEEGYVIGLVSARDPLDPQSVVFSSVASIFALPEFRAALLPTQQSSGWALGRFDVPPLGGLSLERSSFGPGGEQPRAIRPRAIGGFLSAGYASNSEGRHVLALASYDPAGALEGTVIHDLPDSVHEELADLATQPIGPEERFVSVGSIILADPAGAAHPDAIVAARFTADGDLDPSFGTGGVVQLSAGDGGASGAAILVEPTDASLVVVGHAAVEEPSAGGQLHGSPVVFRLDQDGAPVATCGGPAGFVWRPDGQGLFTAETIEELTEGAIAPTYDMVVTDAALDPMGRIVLAGYAHFLEFHGRSAWVGRLNADCSPDLSFGDGGSGVEVIDTSAFSLGSDNAWLSAVAVESTSGRIFVGGTRTNFNTARGFFTGNMFVAALRPDGSLDDTGFVSIGGAGGELVPMEGWHEETHGLVLGPLSGDPGDENRVTLVGSSYADVDGTTRRVRVASFYTTGGLTGLVRPANPPGVDDAFATDATIAPGGGLFLAVAHRSRPVLDPVPRP